MANNYDSSDGVWRTIGGRKVFIKNGQSLSEAMIESGKFKNLRKDYKTAKKEDEIAKFRENMDIDKEIEKLKEELDKMDGRKVFKAQTEKLAELSEMSGISEDKLLDKLADLRGKSLEQYDDLKDEEENTIKYEGLEKYTKLPEVKEDAVNKRERATQMYLDGDISKSELVNDYFGGDKKGAEEYINDLQAEDYVKSGQKQYEKKYSADEQDILDRYGEDYGYDKDKSNIENLKSQIDYMRNPNESINQTAQRLVEGGDFLIYNGDIKDWLDERGIKYNEDNFFEVYKKEMADKIEKLYNEDNVKQVMTNKDLQKQVAMDVAKSFGAKSVKVNGEKINLENRYKTYEGKNGLHYMSEAHPYDETQYSYAYENEDGSWTVKDPTKKTRPVIGSGQAVQDYQLHIYNTAEEAREKMAEIDGRIASNKENRGKNYEGVSYNHYSKEQVSEGTIDHRKETNSKNFEITQDTYFGKQKLGEWEASSKEQAEKEFLESNPQYKDSKKGHLSFTEKEASKNGTNNVKTNNKEAYDSIMKYNKDYDSMKTKIDNEVKAYDTAYKKLSAEKDKYDYGTPERQEITNKLNKLSNEHYNAIKDDRDKVNEIRSIKALEEAGETVLLDKNGKTLFNPEYYKKGDNKHINLGINANTPTVVKDVEILESVTGQLSDGVWENSPGQERYWTNMNFEQHGDEIVFVTPKGSGKYDSYRHKWVNNPFSSKTEQETKDYVANKIKQIVKVEIEDNPSIGKWDRNNQNTLQYLGRHDDVTVAEAYNLYERLKGRTPKQSKSISDTLRNSAYQKYMKEHPGSKMTLDEFLKK